MAPLSPLETKFLDRGLLSTSMLGRLRPDLRAQAWSTARSARQCPKGSLERACLLACLRGQFDRTFWIGESQRKPLADRTRRGPPSREPGDLTPKVQL